MTQTIHSASLGGALAQAQAAPSLAQALFVLDNVRVATKDKILLDIAHLRLPKHKLVAFIGPNGAGKSTLLHSILSQNLTPGLTIAGSITALIDGPNSDNHSSPEQLIRQGKIAWVGQHERFELPLTALDYALLGVSPILSWYQRPKQEHIKRACQLLEDFELGALAHARVQTLSGGEKQRLAIVRALMQQTAILMFDEPTNHLDIRHQRYLLRYLQRLVDEKDKSIIVVLHDLTHAYRYSDEVVLIDAGRVVASGPPEQVMSQQQLTAVYQTDIEVYDTEGGRIFM